MKDFNLFNKNYSIVDDIITTSFIDGSSSITIISPLSDVVNSVTKSIDEIEKKIQSLSVQLEDLKAFLYLLTNKEGN